MIFEQPTKRSFAVALLALGGVVGFLFASLPQLQDPLAVEILEGDQQGLACSLCHQSRANLLAAGVHGNLELDCLQCHDGAEGDHLESLGSRAAPHPRNYSGVQANRLCVDCHSTRSDKFDMQHQGVNWQQRPVCISCHDFHELTTILAQDSRLRMSHQVASPRRFNQSLGDFQVRGGISLGYRMLDGANEGFGTNIQLDEGLILRDAGVETKLEDGADLRLELGGFGESASHARMSWQQPEEFNASLSWRRFEALFNPDSELHDMFTRRENLELNYQALEGSLAEVEFGWQRFKRDATTAATRYRPPTFKLFENTSGERSETIDSLFAAFNFERDGWHYRLRPRLRWWREQDQRSFATFNSNIGSDDFENLNSSSRGWSPSLIVAASKDLSDDLRWTNELFATYSSRRYRVDGESGGELAVGGTYTGSLNADGHLRGRYLRLESGALWQIRPDLAADFLLRFRRDDEDATIPFSEVLTPDPGGASVNQIGTSRNQLSGVDLEAMARARPWTWLDLDFGFGVRAERLKSDGSSVGSPGDRGVLLGLRARPGGGWLLRARSRAFEVSDPFTVISADRRSLSELGARWQGSGPLGVDGAWSRAQTRFAVGTDYAEMNRAHLFATWRAENSLRARAGASWSSYATEVATIANTPLPAAWLVMFSGRTWTWHASASAELTSSVRLDGGFDMVEVLGDNTSNLTMLRCGATHAWNPLTELGLHVNWWVYDGVESDVDDFDVFGVEMSISRLF